MKIIQRESYAQISEILKSIFIGEITHDGRKNVAVTGGASPIKGYELIVDELKNCPTILEDVHFYNFDEFQLEGTFMTRKDLTELLLAPLSVKEENFHHLTMETIDEIAHNIKETGGLDLMVIGLGADGHFCGNMPGNVDFTQEIYKYQLNDNMPGFAEMKAQFPNPEDMISEFVTMGAAMLMKMKHLVMIVNGEKKAEAVKRMLTDDVTVDFPATILRLHPNFTLLLDKEAAKEL